IAIWRRRPRRRHAARPTKAPTSLARSKERDRAIHPRVRSARASIAWRSGRNGRFRATSDVGATRRWRGGSAAHAPSRLPARESEDLELEECGAELGGREPRRGGHLVERSRDAANRGERARFRPAERGQPRPALRPSWGGLDSQKRERVLGTTDQDGVAVVQKTMARGTERFIDVPWNRADRPLHGAGGGGRDEGAALAVALDDHDQIRDRGDELISLRARALARRRSREDLRHEP